VNIFFDVDGTIIESYGLRLRPLVREVFEQLRADGHVLYIWSGVGLRWLEIDRHDLRSLIETCYWKPRYDHHARLAELGVEVFPEFVIDDHAEVVSAFSGVIVDAFDWYSAHDREMERVYRAICARTGQPPAPGIGS
jgi:FMN phosphatase YigB (HAD superfamily)